jgi:hypothetical protein
MAAPLTADRLEIDWQRDLIWDGWWWVAAPNEAARRGWRLQPRVGVFF